MMNDAKKLPALYLSALNERDAARDERDAARVELADRENDLHYEYLRRNEAEDTIDRIKQALHIAAAGVSAVSTAEQMYAELERLPQQIIDAVEQDDLIEDGMIGVQRVREIVQKVSGKPCDDDSLWWTGAEWQAVIGEREDLRAELERLRTAAQGFANVALRYAPTSTGRAWHEAWDVLMSALEV